MENEKNTSIEEKEVLSEQSPAEEKPVKVSSKRIKKIERREAKAARKAANLKEEKSVRPNNALIAILIFGVVIAMFAFVLGYNYFSKPATIAKYIEDNGGEEAYGAVQIDAYTTAAITAEDNSMNIEMTVDDSIEGLEDIMKEFYSGDDGEDQLKQIAAYFLTTMKPETRAFSADVTASIKMGDEELQKTEMTYKEAKKYLEEAEEKAAEKSEQAEDADEEASEDDDAAEAETEDAGDTGDETEDAGDTDDDTEDSADDASEAADAEDGE